VRSVRVDEKLNRYIVDLIHRSREHPDVLLGGSPRASLALYRSSQALAAIRGQAFVTPDDVKRLAPVVLGHRIILKPESRLRKVTTASVVDELLDSAHVPTGGARVMA
jgi:MoxR-like ATPase